MATNTTALVTQPLTDGWIIDIANEVHRAMPAGSDEQEEIVAIVREVLSKLGVNGGVIDGRLDNYRVWPDGTTQLVEDGSPYEFMSDDYIIVAAYDDADAVRQCEEMGRWKV